MASQDQFQRFIFEHSQIRGAWVKLGDSYTEIAKQAPYPASVRELLGESLAASVLMSGTLKFEGILSLQAQGDGSLRTLMAECTHQRTIRGLARFNDTAIQKSGLKELLGQGNMVITITPEQGQRYQGVVPREADSLAGCLQDYFTRSEQIDTGLMLFADENTSAGLLLQRMPGAIDPDNDQWQRVNHLAATLTAEEMLGLDSETLLNRLFHEEEVRLFETEPVRFYCSCSRERTLAALESIGQKECYSILDERESIDMDCQFCHAQYRFVRNDIDHLFSGHSLH